MADDKAQRLNQLQESLDQPLTPEAETALRRELETDPDTRQSANNLERVHQMLTVAPRERAPERLASRIMQRVNAILQEQKAETWQVNQDAVAAAIALANAAAMPLMTGAAWLMIHAASQPELMKTMLPRIISVHLMLIEVMVEVLREAEAYAADDPAAAAAILRLLPEAINAMGGLLDE